MILRSTSVERKQRGSIGQREVRTKSVSLQMHHLYSCIALKLGWYFRINWYLTPVAPEMACSLKSDNSL